ncbi:helix-turn-helix domain-containing protein [Burkholderia thailandensis]|uniref:Helix-turn-helix domain protein n=1 Tax=Burkholderia thailandensis TaxID=57975 RepID=A0AAW9CK09_BURTH|nr:helix-turn-helix domain-containing protein [Burkholderia thailandensis]AHI66557.1 helix-turn-helix domain protein [Burkholderia thailandensis H0587]AOJ53477.1 AraC family transcriptional regulator [Burkholderia thailandensis]AVR28396.1 AraC family transcriptional regulator [Burkholderia thailandensis]MCS3392198.1 helix-turn-helix domain-containing protein [Burkholderia thailandensis]MCS6426079.1 helix-turn-helix domain-containing protein [Burkholderia thailandensis]
MAKTHAPGSGTLLRFFSTDDMPLARAAAFWSAHVFHCEDVRAEQARAFHGHGFLCRCERGRFVRFRGASLDARISDAWLSAATADAHVTICALHAGECTVEAPGLPDARFRANDLFLLDGGRPMRVRWDAPCFSALRLPRASVARTLGQAAMDASPSAASLQSARLAPFLAAELALIGGRGPALSSDELDYVLARAADLGRALLQAALSARVRRGAPARADRLQAAYRYIEQHLHLPALTPERIADAIHCSRTQLYRLFRHESQTVKAALRDARLNRSLGYLERPELALSIGEIAHACGFPDQSTFGKLFRRRFGRTPGEVRRAARGRRDEAEPPDIAQGGDAAHAHQR